MVTVKVAGSTGFRIHFEEELTGLLSTLWMHNLHLLSEWIHRVFWGEAGLFPGRNETSLLLTLPSLPRSLSLLICAIWWLILCSMAPHCREECSWMWNTRTLSLENIHKLVSGLFVILLPVFLHLTISLCADKVELQIWKLEAQTLGHGGPTSSFCTVEPILGH